MVISLILAMQLASPRPVAAAVGGEESAPLTGIVMISRLNLREGPGTHFEIVDVVRRGDKLTVLEQQQECAWLQVTTPAQLTGWVAGKYVSLNAACDALATSSTATPTAPTITPTAPTATLTATPATSAATSTGEPDAAETPTPTENLTAAAVVRILGLNLRDGPGTDYPILDDLQQGDVLEVTGQFGECAWLQVITPDGSKGWVSGAAHYVTFDFSCEGIPLGEIRPLTGEVRRYIGRASLGELTIKNGTDADGMVILTTLDEQPIIAAYIRIEESYKMAGIPDGQYILFFAEGSAWDMEAREFTTTVSHQRFDDILIFATTTSTYSTWEVTLYGVVDGNATTSPVPPEEFPVLE
jgi:uncharacterized protein YgiM (DUF1202 family)